MKHSSPILVVLFLFLAACGHQKTTEEYLQKGTDFLQKKELKSAVIEFKNAVKQSPQNAQARALLGQAYIQTFNTEAAQKELNKAISLGFERQALLLALAKVYDQRGESEKILEEITVSSGMPKNLQAQLMAFRAKAYLRIKKIKRAKGELEKAAQLNSELSDVRLAWAQYEKTKGNDSKAQKWLKPMLEQTPGIADAWSLMGDIEQNASNLKEAEINFSHAIELRKQVHLDYVKRAFIRLKLEDYKGASSDLDVLTKSGSQWPMVLHIAGLVSYKQKDFDKAQEAFEQNLSKHPNYLPSILMMGMTHFNKGNFQNAVSYLERYLAENDNNAQAKFIYAASLLKLQRVTDAIKLLTDLNDDLPGNFRVLSMLGEAHVATGQLDIGIEFLKKAVSVKPDQAGIRLQLGRAMLRSGTASSAEMGQKEVISAIQLDPQLTQADLVLFSSFLKEGKFAKARAVAKKLTRKNQSESLGDNLVALSFLSEKKVDKAEAYLKKTLQKFPADPLSSDNLAKIYLQRNQLKKAKKLYLDVLESNPASLKALNQMALIAARENKQEEILTWLKKAADLNSENLPAKLILTSQYLRLNKFREALTVLQNVGSNDKQNPGFVLLLAKAKMGLKEYTHAIRALKGLIDANPGISAAHFLMAQVYGALNNPAKMRKYLENTLTITPNQLSAHLALARLDMLEGKFDDFKKRVSYLAKSNPENKDVKFLKAKVDSSQRDYDGAIQALSELMKESSNPEVVIDLARNQWQAGNHESAISNLEILLQRHPDMVRAMMLLAQFYLADNRLNAAESTYKKLDKLIPHNPSVLNNLAWILQESNPEKGLEYAQEALKNQPKSPYILDTLAMLQLKNNDSALALKTSLKALEILPASGDIQFNHAKILFANHKKKKARKLLEKLAASSRSYETRRKIELELKRMAR
jgi:putative PEP-CTERM system TPR-repeat lipoprotein